VRIGNLFLEHSKVLESKICNYLNYLSDSEYIAEIVTSPGAVSTLINLLYSNDNEIIGDTCLFIRDFVLSCSRNDTCKQAWDSELESAIIPILEYLLLAENHFIRTSVIYTLGKICSYDSLPVMLDAFYQLRDRDPILLPRFVGELFWLGVDNPWEILESMVASSQYTTRWAVAEILGKFSYDSQDGEENFLILHKFYTQLRLDAYPLVRAQAEYTYQILDLQRQNYRENLSKSDYRKQRKEIKKLEPSLSFSRMESQFSNYIYQHSLFKYTIQELQSFIVCCLAEVS